MHTNGTKYAKAAKKRAINAQTTDNQSLTSYRNTRKKQHRWQVGE
jgi:hypothetical protein